MPHQVRRKAGIKLRRLWRAHRWHLIAAVVLLPVLAAMVTSAVGRSEPRLPSRAELCAGTGRAIDEIAARHPDTPRESLDALEAQVCTNGPSMAPVGKPTAVPATPGCHLLDDGARRSPARVRAVAPSRPVPFFAARSGELPPTGTPRVGGVRLPAGSRCGPFWSTDAGVPDALELARELADAFPSTGLWPVLWSWPSEPPDAYVTGGRGRARVAPLDAGTILRRAWQKLDTEGAFPGLAEGEPAADRLMVEPFGDVLEAAQDEPPPGGPVLMLVPVNRPADVLAVLRPHNTIYFSDHELSAVLRSWEERFGAVVAAISPGGVELVVGAPPRDGEQVNRLAAEQSTLAPDSWTPDELQQLLRSGHTTPGTTSAHHWAFGWPD